MGERVAYRSALVAGRQGGRPGDQRSVKVRAMIPSMEIMTSAALEAGLTVVAGSPAGEGRVELIVRRPATEEREVLAEAVLDSAEGLVGDSWRARGARLEAQL